MNDGGRSGERDARLQRARACLEAFGADPARWPQADRPLFERYKDDFRFEAARADAAALDDALKLTAEGASEGLRARILATAPARRRGFLAAPLFDFASRWRLAPAGALVSLAAIGFFAGVASARNADADGVAAERALAERALAETFGDVGAAEESL